MADNTVGKLLVEIRPTVTDEVACACIIMVNLFLAENDDCDLVKDDDGKWHIATKVGR